MCHDQYDSRELKEKRNNSCFSAAEGHTNETSPSKTINMQKVLLIYRQLTCIAGLANVSGRQNKFPAVRDWALILSMMKSSSSQTDFTCINDCSATAINPLMKMTRSWASLEAERLIHSEGLGSLFVYPEHWDQKEAMFYILIPVIYCSLTRPEARKHTTNEISSSSPQHPWPKKESQTFTFPLKRSTNAPGLKNLLNNGEDFFCCHIQWGGYSEVKCVYP